MDLRIHHCMFFPVTNHPALSLPDPFSPFTLSCFICQPMNHVGFLSFFPISIIAGGILLYELLSLMFDPTHILNFRFCISFHSCFLLSLASLHPLRLALCNYLFPLARQFHKTKTVLVPPLMPVAFRWCVCTVVTTLFTY